MPSPRSFFPLLLLLECALLMVVSAMSASVPFETIDRGQYSAIEERLTEVYRTKQDFDTFWRRHGSNFSPPPDIPDIDFASRMVAAVFQGTQTSGGYGVTVTSVEDDGNALVIRFETTNPSPDAVCTMALTQPYHIASVEVSTKPVRFEGSVKPPPPPSRSFPTYILTFSKETDKVGIVKKIETFDAVKNVRMLTSLGIAMVDFDFEKISSRAEAMQMLQDLDGVASVEEDAPMGI